MKLKILAAALAVGALAACGEQTPRPQVAPEPAASQPAGAGATTSSTSPATTTSGSEERKDGANPVQQQVDPKEAEQRRDFQHPNEKNGPTSPETQPKTGG